MKTGVLYNGYSYFTSPCHPLQFDLQTLEVCPDYEDNININQGIGILNFFEAKNILVTGATGLVGKGIYSFSKKNYVITRMTCKSEWISFRNFYFRNCYMIKES